MRDNHGLMQRLLKIEEGLRLLEADSEADQRWIRWAIENIQTFEVSPIPDDGEGTSTPCESYAIDAMVTTGGCGHSAYTPTFTATLLDADDDVIDSWTATPGATESVAIPGPGAYTLSVEVDNAHRGPATFTATITVTEFQCVRSLTTDTCYATSVGLGVVRGCATLPLEGATVAITGDMTGGGTTDGSGYYSGPYTGATDPPAITFEISGPGFVTQSIERTGDCCHVGYGDVQLVTDDTHVCGCDDECGWPVNRTLTVTDAKGSATLTYGSVGGIAGWRGSHTYTEDEAGEVETVYDAGFAVFRDCCKKVSKSVTVRYLLRCDPIVGGNPDNYRLFRSIPSQCFNLTGTPATRCAALLPTGDIRTTPRLTGYDPSVNPSFSSDNNYAFPCNGGVFNATFNFTNDSGWPPETLSGDAVVTG